MPTVEQDWQDNVIKCTYCGAADVPVALAEGGSTPEYACRSCFTGIYQAGFE